MTLRVLVTGGSGFIGRHLVGRLAQAGFDVTVLSRSVVDTVSGRITYVRGDFTNPEVYARLLPTTDAIYHLAVTTTPGNSNQQIQYDAQTNLMGTLSFVENAARADVKRVIFVSSGGSVYGPNGGTPIPEDHPTNPISAHGVSKLAIEKYLDVFRRQYGISFRVARVANPYGEGQDPDRGQGFIAYALGRLALGQELVIWGEGTVVRDYLYVGDVIDALLLMLSDSGKECVYNVGSGRGYSINQMVAELQMLTGNTAPVRHVAGRAADVPYSCLDIRRIRDELGWEPETQLRDGIARTWRWILDDYLPRHQQAIPAGIAK